MLSDLGAEHPTPNSTSTPQLNYSYLQPQPLPSHITTCTPTKLLQPTTTKRTTMPPKRKRPAPQPSTSTSAAPQPSRLAKAHHVTAAQEALIREAFSLYQIPSASAAPEPDSGAALPTKDVRACLTALGVRIARPQWPEVLETLDPGDEGRVGFEDLFAFAALHLRRGESDEGENVDEDNEEEVRVAFKLFTGGKGAAITLAHLRAVARVVREEVDDEVLKLMISEANGGDWRKGVGRGDFEDVMRRAGAIS